jgi:UDP-N-acetylglucosamine transferase subunit ALG13
VIFVTVGSQLPFDRLIAPVAAWARARGRSDIFFQHCGSAVDLSGFEHTAMLTPDEAARMFDRASVVVSHVGMGTVLGCLERGLPMVLLPRTAAQGETRNDHQSATARRFRDRDDILIAWEESQLETLLDSAIIKVTTRANSGERSARISSHASPRLLSAVRNFVWDGVPPQNS